MKIRVVTDRPWDVPADVLVVPVLGETSLAGPAAELDRRTGGHLGALVEFGELATRRFATILTGAGTMGEDGPRVAHLMAVRAGDAAGLDRETVVKVAATAERRLTGRAVKRLAVWLEPLSALDGGAVAVAELVARGVVEGGYDPQALYRDEPTSPPQLDELVLIAPRASSHPEIETAAERGRIIGEGSNLARTLSNRASNDMSPEVLAEESYGLAKRHGLWI
ncbi:MAG TPA: M17 family peptidase N-terminal domain-containing protein, partial [Candidatus Binatus sp.]|nr:M17 family peptidase N-terminal domain-containing protein [Candidatus Binatus sp.]